LNRLNPASLDICLLIIIVLDRQEAVEDLSQLDANSKENKASLRKICRGAFELG